LSFVLAEPQVQSSSLAGYKKYIALYDFTARSFDELTFKAGDEVWVRIRFIGIK
jgi:SH3 domain